ncbi:MAG: hypothetical protein AAFU70_06890, partial [Planctomycetota bacterium]
MKSILASAALVALLVSTAAAQVNRVIVLGMIHRGHRTAEIYSTDRLERVLRAIEPGYVLTEIPPDAIDGAWSQWREAGAITEGRVRVFPEYTDVLWPLTESMGFEIIPTAGWTAEMARDRSAKLREWRESRRAESEEVGETRAAVRAEMRSAGDPNDPMFIHTDAYDEFVRRAQEPYNRHFNDDLGPGGWDNINAAHWSRIEDALDELSGEGATVVITYGSWHKYWFMDRLRERVRVRGDVELVDPRPYFRAE